MNFFKQKTIPSTAPLSEERLKNTDKILSVDEHMSQIVNFISTDSKNNGIVDGIKEVLKAVEQKIDLLEKLSLVGNKLDSLQKEEKKLGKRVVDATKKGDYVQVSRIEKERGEVNKEYKLLENEIKAKVEYLKELGNKVFEVEKLYLKQIQINFFSSCLLCFDMDTSHMNVGLQCSLKDEFLKFSMELEAKVIERKKRFEFDEVIIESKENTDTTQVETEFQETTLKKSVSEMIKEKYVAVYAYKPDREDEIELKENDVLIVEEKSEDGWFKGKNLTTEEQGFFPGNYCKLTLAA
eukprot:snap_masked-scaffold_102-processed-gene-0.8-mRNA-1 protein AED:0.42 eAED:0.44 QI:0/0/0/0.5/1/1/2/0/294